MTATRKLSHAEPDGPEVGLEEITTPVTDPAINSGLP